MAQRYGVTPSSLAYQDIPSLNLDIYIFRKAIEKETADAKKQEILGRMKATGMGTKPGRTRRHVPKVRY